MNRAIPVFGPNAENCFKNKKYLESQFKNT